VLRSGETSFSYEREFSRCRGWGAGGTTSTGFMAGFR
jgi:hypothetical protein